MDIPQFLRFWQLYATIFLLIFPGVNFSQPCTLTLSGSYTINSAQPTSGANFQNFTAAINTLTSCGVSGPVIFNVDPASGPYNEQITIPQIAGASATNTITFSG